MKARLLTCLAIVGMAILLGVVYIPVRLDDRVVAQGAHVVFLPIVARPPQQGIAYASWWPGEYSRRNSDRSLAALKATGANWISLLVTFYQDNIHSTDMHASSSTPTDADLARAIITAHSLGLKVMLKPHLDLSNDPTHYRGEIVFHNEADWSAWFDSYRSFIYHFADLAQRHDVELFCVGCELSGTVHRESDWRQTIAGVRARFHGPLVYASNFGWEETAVQWWDALDYIGVDAYYPLTDKDDPSLQELKAAWSPHASGLAHLAARWRKPILLTEIGYRSADGANRHPWDWWTPGALDLQEQADCYQAAFESVYGKPWFAGMYWWAWTTDALLGGRCDTGFTPQLKPAEEVLRVWYGAPQASPVPTPTSSLITVITIYSDSLSAGWQDWSWGAMVNLAAADHVYRGTHAIGVSLQPYGNLHLWHAPFSTAAYSLLEFHIRGGSSPGPDLQVIVTDERDLPLGARAINDTRYIQDGRVGAGVWKRVLIPLEHLNAANRLIQGLILQDCSRQGAARFWVDEIRLLR